MVSLESQNMYLNEALANDKLNAFYSLIEGQNIELPSSNLTEIDTIYYGIVESILKNDKSIFQNYYRKLSKRKPSSEAPFIHNDLLMFSIAAGLKVFNIDNSWMLTVLSKRAKSSMTTTFDNILNENFYSKSNVQEVVLVFLNLTTEDFKTDFLKSSFESIKSNVRLFESKNDFQILSAIKAFEIVIASNHLDSQNDLSILKSFERRFRKRVKIISQITYILILLAVGYFLFDLTRSNKFIKELIGEVNTIFGLLGYGILSSGLFALFKNRMELMILKLFGYKPNAN